MKRRNYTFALTQNNDYVKRIVEKYPKYAYIYHDKDDATPHYHYYIEFPNPRSISSVSKELKIPENMIEAVYNKAGILSYLTHDNAKGKHHYDISEIKSNFDISTEIARDPRYPTPEERKIIVSAICDYEEGKISYRQLVNLMEGLNIPLTYTQLFSLYTRAIKTRNVGLSTFRVPCSTTSDNGTERRNQKT